MALHPFKENLRRCEDGMVRIDDSLQKVIVWVESCVSIKVGVLPPTRQRFNHCLVVTDNFTGCRRWERTMGESEEVLEKNSCRRGAGTFCSMGRDGTGSGTSNFK